MKIKTEPCWNETFRLTLPGGAREVIHAEKWNRKTSTEALNLLERVYNLKRKNIRFI